MSFWQKLKNKCWCHNWAYFWFAPWEEYRICRKCSKAQEVQYPFGWIAPNGTVVPLVSKLVKRAERLEAVAEAAKRYLDPMPENLTEKDVADKMKALAALRQALAESGKL